MTTIQKLTKHMYQLERKRNGFCDDCGVVYNNAKWNELHAKVEDMRKCIQQLKEWGIR